MNVLVIKFNLLSDQLILFRHRIATTLRMHELTYSLLIHVVAGVQIQNHNYLLLLVNMPI